MLIKECNYQNVVIVGHSSDEDLSVHNKFKEAGADFFETKPPVLNNFKQIIVSILMKK
jgi:hypothetical protein